MQKSFWWLSLLQPPLLLLCCSFTQRTDLQNHSDAGGWFQRKIFSQRRADCSGASVGLTVSFCFSLFVYGLAWKHEWKSAVGSVGSYRLGRFGGEACVCWRPAVTRESATICCPAQIHEWKQKCELHFLLRVNNPLFYNFKCFQAKTDKIQA